LRTTSRGEDTTYRSPEARDAKRGGPNERRKNDVRIHDPC